MGRRLKTWKTWETEPINRVPCFAKASAAAKAMADKSQGRPGSAFRVPGGEGSAPKEAEASRLCFHDLTAARRRRHYQARR
jgi:hypothetical protein